jgi:Polyketide cyclase / dehydrase and lipid transport
MGPMMRLVLGLVVLVGIMAAVAVGLPAHVTVARSVVINAPEYAIYPYLNNLHQFSEWSPWATRDPGMKVTYSGPQEGNGAKVEWVSEVPSVGTGSMEIVGSEPSRSMDLAANLNGLEGTSSYELVPAGSGSKVTWSFGYETGSSPLKRWKGLMLDGFIGAEYHAGLEKLKARVEEDRRPTAPPVTPPPQAGGTSSEAEQPSAAGETVAPQTPAQAQGTEQAAPADAAPAPTPQPKSKRRKSQR